MSRKHDEPTVSRHLEVYAADWEYLNTHFGRGSPTRLGTAVAIRQLIRKGVRAHQERVARRVEAAGAGTGADTGSTRIIMDAPPDLENCQPFVQVARLMDAAGLKVPQILDWDEAHGFMLLTDLGRETMMQALDPASPGAAGQIRRRRPLRSGVGIYATGRPAARRPETCCPGNGFADAGLRGARARCAGHCCGE